MSTFDSSRYDVPALVEKLRDQRFDGYDAETLALEIGKFRSGAGTAGLGDAVDALKQVAGALSHTDTTLREQLAALGVSWHSEAGGQASTVLSDQAGFSADANEKVAAAAQLIFQQGEAFNRTKNKLPDPAALRQGEDGYTVTDTLFSLFGFETDHAASVKASAEAKAQAVDALNSYAHDSGNYLASSQPVAAPQSMNLLSSPGAAVESVAGPTIAPVPPVPDVPEVSPTVAAGTKGTKVHATPVAATSPSPGHTTAHAPTPPIGVPVAPPQTGATTPAQVTAPNPATHSPATEPVTGVVNGSQPRADRQETVARPNPGQPPLAAGQQVTSGFVGAGPAAERAASVGRPGGIPAEAGRPGGVPAEGAARVPGAEALLGKGKSFGSVPGATSGPANVGPGFTNLRAAGGVGALAEGTPAIGAAGVSGVTSGEPERERPGRGSAAKRIHRLPVGEVPGEEEALRARRTAPQPPSTAQTRAILEPAATQDGEEDAHHVRRYGVDDHDLFTDQREVSVDLIGGKPLPEE
ncbi:hypothetical protein [Amycolatopsis pithecellobii]|uniref:PPE domain-containing protein n=1 Tax=Amycolatopsis pithecellobii TaxID=664692 RepID=A0A6N7Z849_9PSEU|nr:hypothetical protein [Amycolatopsis pithecellobii]MTD57701.1 hypothetical protein [Amycolatopsis pithecellobii]